MLNAGAVLASSLVPRLVILAMLMIPLCPRRSWDYSSKHAIGDGVTVVRQTHVVRCGFPLQCAELRWYEWSAAREGKSIDVTNGHVRAFASLEYFAVLSRGLQRTVPQQTLDYRSDRREEILLQSDPRRSNLVVRWGLLGTNAIVCFLPGLAYFYWRQKRRIVRFERRRRSGRCGTCDYDLTGNISGRCPECGASVERGETPLGEHS
jgi:hypothetical protein